ncbi:hypothetical protein ALT721_940029 [Alteromonas alvinellae]
MKDMPQLGMGTFRLKGEEARESVSKALEVGFRHIDTAQFYDNEAQVGDAIKPAGLIEANYLSPPRCGTSHWAMLILFQVFTKA